MGIYKKQMRNDRLQSKYTLMRKKLSINQNSTHKYSIKSIYMEAIPYNPVET